MKCTSEIWKFVPGYEDYYMVSSAGTVRSVDRMVVSSNGIVKLYRGRIRKPQKVWSGYWQVMLCKDGTAKWYRIHQLVAMAFLVRMPEFTEINHKDGNKDNNSIENLEYVTRKYNMNHALKSGLIKPFKKAVIQIDLSGKPVAKYNSIKEALSSLGIAATNIGSCCSGKNKIAHGFQWKYYSNPSDLTINYGAVAPKKPPTLKTVIHQYNTKNQLIAVFRKMADAANSVGVSRQAIQQACAGISKTTAGYVWKKVSLDE